MYREKNEKLSERFIIAIIISIGLLYVSLYGLYNHDDDITNDYGRIYFLLNMVI